jgi:hypothetical protein
MEIVLVELRPDEKFLENVKTSGQFGCKFRRKEALDVVRVSFWKVTFILKMTILCKFPCLRGTIECRTLLSPDRE